MSDEAAESLLLKKEQGMLSSRQQANFKHVIEFKRIRNLNQHHIHMTKDVFDGECSQCQKAAAEHRKTYWGEDE